MPWSSWYTKSRSWEECQVEKNGIQRENEVTVWR